MKKLILLISAMAWGSVAQGKMVATADRVPMPISTLLDCQHVTDSAARLACFDRASANVTQAIGRHDLLVVDREAVRSAKRSLFGFSVPNFGIFGGDKEEVKQLDGVLAFASRNRDGGYVLGLQDGSQWSQIDDRPLAIEPRPGDKITVHRAALGSFMLNVGRMPGIRVKRVN